MSVEKLGASWWTSAVTEVGEKNASSIISDCAVEVSDAVPSDST